LEDFLFKGKSRRRVYERIQELEQAGLLQKERVLACNRQKLIRLTRSGIKYVEGSFLARIPQFKRPSLETLIHDAMVTSVRLRLREFWDGSWLPEGLLKKKEYPHIPDGIVLFSSGKRIAIEVENSLKGKSRFIKLLEQWANGSSTPVSMVLYVATTPTLQKLIRGYLEEAHQKGIQKPIFGLVLWETLRTEAPRPFSAHGELELFSRRSF